MFPLIEQRGGDLSPVTSDFSEIVELQQFKRLYEEQEEKVKLRLAEKDQEIAGLQQTVLQRDNQIEEAKARLQEMTQERERLRGDYARLRTEAQEKIDKLMERIKELNQRLMGGDSGAQKTGIFR
jgi:chromosome segregation ATPase